jgi:hypothetical protein
VVHAETARIRSAGSKRPAHSPAVFLCAKTKFDGKRAKNATIALRIPHANPSVILLGFNGTRVAFPDDAGGLRDPFGIDSRSRRHQRTFFVTMSTTGATSVIAHASRVARDVPSLAQFYL